MNTWVKEQRIDSSAFLESFSWSLFGPSQHMDKWIILCQEFLPKIMDVALLSWIDSIHIGSVNVHNKHRNVSNATLLSNFNKKEWILWEISLPHVYLD